MNNYYLQILCTVAKLFFPSLAWIPVKTIIAQARLETGNFTSKSFTVGNNLFGTKKPAKRKYWGDGEYLGHGKYKTVFHSILDFFERHKAFPKALAQSNGDYYGFLKASGYAEDPNYISKLKKIESTIELLPSAALALPVMAAVELAVKSIYDNEK